MTAGINTAFDRLASCPMFEEGRDCVLLLLRACGDGFCQKRCLVHMSLHYFTSTSRPLLSNTGKREFTNFVCQLHKSCLHKLRFVKKTKSSPGLSVSLLHTPNLNTQITPHSQLNPCLTADLDVGRSGAAERLDGEDLVVEVAGGESVVLPGGEVVGDGDSSAGALVLADREVLAESAGTLDGRLVDLGVLADLVGRAVAGDAADSLGATDRARVVAVVLNDVVLGERAVDPAVDSKVRALVGRVATAVVDDSVSSSSVPTKANYEVARVVPVGSESSGALVVLEVGKVAVVVLDIANGLTALKLVVDLLRLRQSDRRSSGRAEKSEKSGSELHVDDDDDRRRGGWFELFDDFQKVSEHSFCFCIIPDGL